MKVGDLIKFSEWHTSQPGYEYTADWVGLIYGGSKHGSRAKVYWITGEGAAVLGSIPLKDNKRYSVIK